MDNKENLEEGKILKITEACSLFYDFDVLKQTLKSDFSKEDLFKHFLRTYAGARPKAPKQLYLLGIQLVSEYGSDLSKIKQELNELSSKMIKSYNLFETDYQCKNIFQLWNSIYRAIKDKKIETAYYDLCCLNGVKGKIAAFFLRDLGAILFNHNKPKKCSIKTENDNLEFMQPIDIWLRKIASILYNKNKIKLDLSNMTTKFCNTLSEGKRDYKKIIWILTKCKQYDINPLCFNQGAWFLGSQIIGNTQYLEKLLQKSEDLLNAIKNTKICLDENKFSVFFGTVDS